jgi:hypothetical protein
MTKLSDTQRVILSKAAQHEALLAESPAKLPAAARQSVLRSLIAKGVLEEVPAPRGHISLGWRQDGDGAWIALRITAAGLAAIGVVAEAEAVEQVRPAETSPEAADTAPSQEPRDTPDLPAAAQGESLAAPELAPPSTSGEAPQGPQHPPVSPHGGNGRLTALRVAASAVIAAWDAPARDGLEEVIAGLRNAMASMPQQARAAAHQPRSGTKQETVLALLRREEGATITQVMEATGWQPHTVRGFLAGLKRRAIAVEVLERVRQIGPNKQGAKGSYSIYRIAAPDAAASPAEAG